MPSFISKAALVASAGMALAAPAEIAGRSAFELTQVEGPKIFKSGPLAMMKTYNKYAKIGAVAPEKVVSAAAAVQSGSVTANPTQYDSSYLVSVKLGTSSEALNLDFDTGSSDL